MSIIESFLDLDLDEILNSIESAGFSPSGHCLALNSLENRVYRIGLESESISNIEANPTSINPSSLKIESVVVKFYRPGRWTKEQIQEEHDFLYELEESEIPVLTPIQNSSGQSVHSAFIHPEDKSQAIYYTLWPTLRGRIVEEFQEEDLRLVGSLLARIHNVGSANESTSRIRLNLQDYAEPALENILSQPNVSLNVGKRYSDIAGKFFTEYESLSMDIPKIRIHGDCHRGNLLTLDSQFTFLDFDDMMTGIPVQDLWMLLPFGDSRCDYERELFLEGYRGFREFPEHWFRLVDPLRAIRYIYYSSWIARRWNDPAFPNAFPHFGTESYWEKELRDLEQLYYNYMEGEV
jgi:Ser/Thr protein kinase RdoA (MazF antagonist)